MPPVTGAGGAGGAEELGVLRGGRRGGGAEGAEGAGGAEELGVLRELRS
ncbi:MAG: hypothetical protein F6J92_19435 [Symploca sp. SIO1A3]|nr:hypothetical protein [Symploca sp. SIO1A3]